MPDGGGGRLHNDILAVHVGVGGGYKLHQCLRGEGEGYKFYQCLRGVGRLYILPVPEGRGGRGKG